VPYFRLISTHTYIIPYTYTYSFAFLYCSVFLWWVAKKLLTIIFNPHLLFTFSMPLLFLFHLLFFSLSFCYQHYGIKTIYFSKQFRFLHHIICPYFAPNTHIIYYYLFTTKLAVIALKSLSISFTNFCHFSTIYLCPQFPSAFMSNLFQSFIQSLYNYLLININTFCINQLYYFFHYSLFISFSFCFIQWFK
jgi:hypothetical protein